MTAVSVGVPSYDGMKTQTAFALVSAVQCLRETGYDVHLTARQGPYTHWNREGLVEDARSAGTDYLMMIDADLYFPSDGIVRLLRHEKDVVAGLYMMKTLPPVNPIKLSDGNGGYLGIKKWKPPPEVFRCAAVPTGFMLIRMAAIRDLPAPLFPCVQPVGEDVAFCQAVEAAGLEVWCDPTFKIDHIGDYHY